MPKDHSKSVTNQTTFQEISEAETKEKQSTTSPSTTTDSFWKNHLTIQNIIYNFLSPPPHEDMINVSLKLRKNNKKYKITENEMEKRKF